MTGGGGEMIITIREKVEAQINLHMPIVIKQNIRRTIVIV